ncbi:hypothetical protein [Brevundimonas sp. FT23028]|uniref:hypothetical protein n=1 Tax=Brevundimonas sp. FT23028 TaxID=3393748 RepID=UPI003B587932
MNIGFGSSQKLSAEAETSIGELAGAADLLWLDDSGFYSEFRAPMRRTFEALGCPHVFSLKETGSPHAPRLDEARKIICGIANILLRDGAEPAALIFAAEFDEDPRYASGSPEELDYLIRSHLWADNRMRFSDRGERRPYYVQEYSEVPFVFRITPPSV